MKLKEEAEKLKAAEDSRLLALRKNLEKEKEEHERLEGERQQLKLEQAKTIQEASQPNERNTCHADVNGDLTEAENRSLYATKIINFLSAERVFIWGVNFSLGNFAVGIGRIFIHNIS